MELAFNQRNLHPVEARASPGKPVCLKDVEKDHTELPGTKPAMEMSGVEPESEMKVSTYKADRRAKPGRGVAPLLH
jgi:hypothetical protein